MTPENLLSGLIGGLVVGLLGVAGVFLLVRADDRRWRRENRAAARLLYHEIINNRIWLRAIVMENTPEWSTMISQSVWQAEQVRVASLLSDDSLNTMGAAQFTLSGILRTRLVLGDEVWMKEVKEGDGKERVTQTLRLLDETVAILEHAMEEQPWWRSATVPGAGAWLGVSGGGLMRLRYPDPHREQVLRPRRDLRGQDK